MTTAEGVTSSVAAEKKTKPSSSLYIRTLTPRRPSHPTAGNDIFSNASRPSWRTLTLSLSLACLPACLLARSLPAVLFLSPPSVRVHTAANLSPPTRDGTELEQCVQRAAASLASHRQDEGAGDVPGQRPTPHDLGVMHYFLAG
ncbi:hypothetical protein ACJBU6_08091 [Exserohilum turcicum]